MSDPANGMLDKARMAELGRFYRKHLLEDVMPFWEKRTADTECGGYLTCFDRQGNVTDVEKYIWFQGRQLWMFSALYNRIEKRPNWLELARMGRDFIVAHAYAGDGRWNYQLDRRGGLRKGTISTFTDHFVLSGLSEYAVAANSDQDAELIRDTYDAIERAVHDPEFKDIFHGTWSPRFKRHGIHMMCVHVAGLAGQVLGDERTRPLIDYCLEQVLHVFAHDDRRMLLESVAPDGSFVDDDEGRVVNPGHALESMWFCMEEGRKRRDRAIIERAVQIADWTYQLGHDPEYGGIFSFLDANGQQPTQMDWHKETQMSWDDKVWWVHSEALYALALAAVETDSREFYDRFLALHEWCQQHFYDAEYGEWYPELYRDGRPKKTDKGTLWKAAYHLPRALMYLALLFEDASGP